MGSPQYISIAAVPEADYVCNFLLQISQGYLEVDEGQRFYYVQFWILGPLGLSYRFPLIFDRKVS